MIVVPPGRVPPLVFYQDPSKKKKKSLRVHKIMSSSGWVTCTPLAETLRQCLVALAASAWHLGSPCSQASLVLILFVILHLRILLSQQTLAVVQIRVEHVVEVVRLELLLYLADQPTLT